MVGVAIEVGAGGGTILDEGLWETQASQLQEIPLKLFGCPLCLSQPENCRIPGGIHWE